MRPLLASSATCLKRSAALPLGVSAVTTWLNLMMTGACAAAIGATVASTAHTPAASAARRWRDVDKACLLSVFELVLRRILGVPFAARNCGVPHLFPRALARRAERRAAPSRPASPRGIGRCTHRPRGCHVARLAHARADHRRDPAAAA